MIVIGIDPGKNGGIAILDSAGKATTLRIPETSTDLWDAVADNFWESVCGDEVAPVVFIEKVSAGPKMGSSAAFKFGRNVGEIHMACIGNGLRVEYVTPQKWQKDFGLIVRGRGLGQGDTAKKNRNKAKAQELFPGIKITHAIADALLIAEYGRRVLAKNGETRNRGQLDTLGNGKE